MSRIKIASYGGGTNSTAMLIHLAKSGESPDHILFADTGGEKPETYQYVQYFSDWLTSRGMPPIETVRYRTREGLPLTLEQDVLNNNTLPSIAFGWKTCSQKFKIAPQEKFINERYKGCEIVHLIGFDAGEQKRVKKNPITGHVNTYPLIELGWDRARCVSEILAAGLRLPGKSSCFFCPNMRRGEVLQLSCDQKLRVKRMEANATKVAELKGLGRRWSWTDLINADESQMSIFDDLDVYQAPCECID